jgi:CRISPR-associated protein Cmr5
MRTREQEYAVTVFDQVSRLKEAYKADPKQIDPKKYGSLCHTLPVLIRTAGLIQALAFVEARGKDAGKQLLADLAQTVGTPNLVDTAHKATLGPYMRLTQQVLDALLWYKRFAQSVLNVDASQTEEVSR